MCMLIKHLQEPEKMQGTLQGEARMDESKNGYLFIYKIYKTAQMLAHLWFRAEYISYNKKQLTSNKRNIKAI